jgi:exodeoxyribonuclease V beta subunit
MTDFNVDTVPLAGTLLLEASAGTGKTWNLVRIVDRLVREYKTPPEKLLLVTFTNDAVNELRNRQRELTPDMGKMTITTIHGFCSSLLQQLPFESGVPFRMEPAADGGEVLYDVLRDFLRRDGWSDDAETAEAWGRLLLTKGDSGAVEHLYKGLKEFVEDPSLRLSGTPDTDTGIKKIFRRLTETALSELREQKKRLGLIDYSGMIDLVHTLVTGSGPETEAFVTAVRNRYSTALIDEFQDTDSRQWEIFRTLFGVPGGTLILIGDPKQSIYGFRGSDLTQYRKARESVPAENRWCLRSNFRSTRPLIETFGNLFTPLFKEEYQPQEKGDKPGSPVPLFCDPAGNPAIPVRFIPLDAEKAAIGKVRRDWFRLVADRIRSLVGDRWLLGDRPVRAADFLVLVDKNNHGEMIRALLRERGILAVTCSGSPVTEEREAEHFVRLAAALAEPDKRGPVCGALMTLFFRFSPATLFALEEEGGLDRWHTLFAGWKAMVDRGDLLGALDQIFSADEAHLLPERLLGEPGGERILTNIRHLAELYQQEILKGGLDSRRFYQRLLSGRLQTPDPEAREIRLDREGNLVRIMTIHKAKGLEAPLVFYAGGFRETGRTRYPDIWLDESLGCRCFSPEPDKEEKAKKKEAAFQETQRLFYVALTRAASALWLPLPSAEIRESKYASYGDLYGLWATDGDKDPEPFIAGLEKGGLAAVEPLPEPGPALPVTEEALSSPESPEGKLPPGLDKRIQPVSSFTSLMRESEAAGGSGGDHPDDRDRAPEISPERRAALKAEDPLSGLGGPVFGELIHNLLEILDLTLADGRTEAEFRELEAVKIPVQLALRRYYPAGKERQFYQPVTGLLHRVLTVPVPGAGGKPLCRIPPDKTIREMEFLYPDPDAAGGFIKGFIDFVFEAEGKIYLADWKTNLPESDDPRAPFDRPMMEKVMDLHNYRLQERLYRQALLKYMEKSGIPACNFGGSYYFFLRGMDKEGMGMYFIGNHQ